MISMLGSVVSFPRAWPVNLSGEALASLLGPLPPVPNRCRKCKAVMAAQGREHIPCRLVVPLHQKDEAKKTIANSIGGQKGC
eukprot:1159421-Pelagomonas_calceolata.AAC.17